MHQFRQDAFDAFKQGYGVRPEVLALTKNSSAGCEAFSSDMRLEGMHSLDRFVCTRMYMYLCIYVDEV